MPRDKRNWDALRREYETTDITRSQMIEKYGIPEGTLRSRMTKEGWRKKKNELSQPESKIIRDHPEINKSSRESIRDELSKNDRDKSNRPKCGARKRQGDHSPCQRPAGWGTPHPGTGKCKLHGGCTPVGEPGNKAALKTGEYESILFDLLSDEEKEAWYRVNTDKLAQLDEEIRKTELRQRRMWERIERLRQVDHTMVSYEVETGGGGEDGDGKPKVKQKYDGTLGQIQQIEEALTRVQAHKARLIKLKLELEELELRKRIEEMKNW